MRGTLLLAAYAFVAACFLYAHFARAQIGNGALVVQTCGALPQPYAVGSTRSITINITGQRC